MRVILITTATAIITEMWTLDVPDDADLTPDALLDSIGSETVSVVSVEDTSVTDEQDREALDVIIPANA
jgi:hypothetical protein